MIDLSTDIKTAIKARNGVVGVYREQDVAPILDINKRMQADSPGSWRSTARQTRRKIAEIPNIVAEMWLKQGFNVFSASEKELRKKLDDPDWSYLKAIPGKIGQRTRHI